MKKSTSGFTIVELLVVIAVIGILTTITLFGFTRYQISTRDTDRQSKVVILGEALEKYYDKNGEYPGCVAVNGANTASISANVLLGVESKTYLTPQSPTGNTNSIECLDITGAASEGDVFAYVGDGSAACSSGAACLGWTLKYKEEATGTIKSLKSRRATNIATSGTLAVSTNPTGFTQIDTSWTSVNNALSYDLQWSTDSAFTSPNTQSIASPNSLSVTGLTFDTLYYFRVRATAAVSQGVWSPVVSARTWGLASPTMAAATISSTAINTTWNATTHAANYTVQCSTDQATWTGCGGSASTTASPHLFSGLNQGTRYYFRVQATNGSYSSAWSNIDNAVTSIDSPLAYGMAYGNTSARWNFLDATSAAVCPAGTTPSYDWYYDGGNFWVSGTQYQSVSWQYSGWNQSKTLSVASRCITSAASSGFVWANNTGSGNLTWPTTWTWLPGDSTMHWAGVCPTYTTSNNFYWRTNGNINASGNTSLSEYSSPPTWYTGTNWGNGMARVTLSCVGPWGTASIDGTSSYGPGCVPTITLAVCTQG